MKIRDTLALGTIAGVIGSIPTIILNFISVQAGFSKYYSFQIAAGVIRQFENNLMEMLIGGITWVLTSAVLGILTVLIIRFTGKDYWWLKGIIVTNGLMYTVIYGLVYSLGGSKIVPTDILTNLTHLIGLFIFGITMSYLILRWGEIKVFDFLK